MLHVDKASREELIQAIHEDSDLSKFMKSLDLDNAPTEVIRSRIREWIEGDDETAFGVVHKW